MRTSASIPTAIARITSRSGGGSCCCTGTKSEKLQEKTREKGLTVIPTKLYMKGGLIKCEIAVGKGKKLHDKREAERAKEADNEARAAVRRSRE